MIKLVDLMHLCIKHDAIFEISGGNVKVIKYKGEWIPNSRPILWASCCVSDEVGLGEIYGKLQNTCGK